MEHNNISDRCKEPLAMTYGMSDKLLNSDLLQRIDELSISDKRCIISYISEEVEVNSLEEDEWDRGHLGYTQKPGEPDKEIEH